MRVFCFLLLGVFTAISNQCFAQYLVTAKAIGSTGSDAGYSTAVDASGNIYTTGTFSGTVDFDPSAGATNLTAAGTDVFVIKMDAAGNLIWAKNMGGANSDQGNSIAVDALGNVYTTGYFLWSGDFDPGAGTTTLTNSSGNDVFVSKLDASGNFVWARNLGGWSGPNIGYSIKVDASGNVYTTGYFGGTADFDPGAGTTNLTSAGGTSIFIWKLNSSGSLVWARSVGNMEYNQGNSIALDGTSNIYVTGYFAGTVDFDPGAGTTNLTAAGYNDIFILKLNSSGNFVWARSLGSTNNDIGHSIAVDVSGNSYTTGYFRGTVDFDLGVGTTNLTSAGSSNDIFILKLDASGNLVWVKSMGTTTSEIGYSIAVDAASNVYTTGYFSGTVDFDPGAGTANLTSAGGTDIFMSRLDASGNYVWANSIGSTLSDQGRSISVNSSGRIYMTGYFSGTADFDPRAETTNLSNGGGNDIFIASFSETALLPLVFGRFDAAHSEVGVHLTWQTLSEQNTQSFEVQRSATGSNFIPIGSVKAAGNSSFALNYSFTDRVPLSGVSYFRLKQTDNDGRYTYSKVEAVSTQNYMEKVVLYPNPVRQKATLQFFLSSSEQLQYSVLDQNGRILDAKSLHLNKGSNSVTIPVQDLPKGVYTLRLQGATISRQLQLIRL